MAKIDTSAIEGYESMSAEEKLAALEGYEYDDNSSKFAELAADVKRYKDAQSKASSEAADYKRQLNEARASEGTAQTEAEKRIAEMEAQLKQLGRDKTISDYCARLVSQGYDAELAMASATSLADGDMDAVFENMSKFLEAHDTKLRASLAQKSIEPGRGNQNPYEGMTRKRLLAMSPLERNAYSQKYPEEFKKLMGI
ncbi:hypothetical protein DXD59_00555 [Olsenella sp. TM06-36]|uniref:hypothetical protein n=1 Tax=Olsenella sp. TM06-36 TaxID=2292361 RepID=UPI000E4347A7|nr:hypothetical protein [Olsenella sp. TM06-36]RGJ47421.1 hypothetical protein DXD59_00555 [Olsenella sp. TM06-36]